jgi:bifunctional glutamyl/prolyl-tRNA synthetase
MGAKALCIPFDQPKPVKPGQTCIHPSCKNKAKFYTLFGRSYWSRSDLIICETKLTNFW